MSSDLWWNGKNLNTHKIGWFPSTKIQMTDEIHKTDGVEPDVAEVILDFNPIPSQYTTIPLKTGEKVLVFIVKKKKKKLKNFFYKQKK